MGDRVEYSAEAKLEEFPRHIRNIVAMGGGVAICPNDKDALRLARAIERGLDPDRITIVYRDAPMSRWEAVLHTLALGLCMFGFMGDAVLALIDLARLMIAAVLP